MNGKPSFISRWTGANGSAQGKGEEQAGPHSLGESNRIHIHDIIFKSWSKGRGKNYIQMALVAISSSQARARSRMNLRMAPRPEHHAISIPPNYKRRAHHS